MSFDIVDVLKSHVGVSLDAVEMFKLFKTLRAELWRDVPFEYKVEDMFDHAQREGLIGVEEDGQLTIRPKPIPSKPPALIDEVWLCKLCGKPSCCSPGGLLCKCSQPRWEIFNRRTGETYAPPAWWTKRYPENS